MYRIKLSATDSTNAHLKRLMQERDLPDGTLVAAAVQTRGRGQPGAGWISERDKNLTFSLLKLFQALPAREHFRLNMCVSLAIAQVLDALEIPEITVKWPNDILSGRFKVCGILIENSLQGDRIAHSIIGIGLNVNQTTFPGLPSASSLCLRAGKPFDTGDVLDALEGKLLESLRDPASRPLESIRRQYESRLFLKDQPGIFSSGAEREFEGIIRGVGPQGRLRVERRGLGIRTYDFREIRMHY
ncbi:biotin--[acetyl-CoA-carboxylase] ligase [Robiginitalea sp. SC105]|uniref:biotin--[acetyl-CoA-carboxylase] ligase n=1 Tax=Robiginitalea sp. SC105 TaxID=2762332 RepID=UPI001639FC43|nr:biotin--[acetyl-CoA-carboxylase] ligase [Robiginitalea sp. SC105]MBC2839097.1 biotin--[acetyl-CoA-carboxylase] ligase [Robiginitalea sp. SC105]